MNVHTVASARRTSVHAAALRDDKIVRHRPARDLSDAAAQREEFPR